jgi:hypothetical protein
MDKIIHIKYFIRITTNNGGKSAECYADILLSRIESILPTCIIMKSGHVFNNIQDSQEILKIWEKNINFFGKI